MEDDKWWNPADEEKKSPKEEINDLLNEAEKKRLQREEEIAEAEHKLKLSQLNALTSDSVNGPGLGIPEVGPDGNLINSGSSTIPKITNPMENINSNDSKSGGDGTMAKRTSFTLPDWLSPGELIFVSIALLLTIGTSLLMTYQFTNQVDWELTDAKLIGSDDIQWIEVNATIENDTGWFEDVEERSYWYEDCYTDYDGYEVCDQYTEYYDYYTCYADLNLSYTIDGVSYVNWQYTPEIMGEWPCLEDIEFYFQIGDNVSIEVNSNDHSDYQVFAISHGSPSGTVWNEILLFPADSYDIYLYYSCYADLVYSYTYSSGSAVETSYTGSFSSPSISSDIPCIDYMQNLYPIESIVQVYVNPENPSESAEIHPDKFTINELFCCMLSLIIFLLISFIYVRFSNYDQQVGFQGGDQGYGGYGGMPPFTGPWYYRPFYRPYGYFRRRRHFHRSSSGRRRAMSRSSGGGRPRGSRRSGGGRKSGGGGRSGGGRRSGGGGRSGGGRRR
ncbi:MAG: hypothetical protein ACPG8U_03760 [Candidatus Thalassarchaeaceae archaeon]